jgi:two-component system nitrate/nitrite response regulator NarL
VLLVTRARLLRDMIGRVLTAGGYAVLGQERCGDGRDFDPAPSEYASKADLVIVVHEGDEISRAVLNQVREGAGGKVILLLRESRIGVSRELLEDVDGVVNDEVSTESLLQALRMIQRGERVVPRHLAQSLTKPGSSVGEVRQKEKGPGSLSPREQEIVRRLVRGESNKVIAHGLSITEATVKVHLKAVLRKISVDNRTQAAIWAMNNGFDQHLNR